MVREIEQKDIQFLLEVERMSIVRLFHKRQTRIGGCLFQRTKTKTGGVLGVGFDVLSAYLAVPRDAPVH